MTVRALGAALLGAALLAAAVPATAQNALTGKLPGGAAYVVRPLGGAPVATIALWYRAPAAGFGTPVPGLGRLAAGTIAASQPVTGQPLIQFVEAAGGRLEIAAYPESIAISALVPADRAAATIQEMTRAYFSPVLSAAGLTVAKRDQAREVELRSFSAEDAIDEALYDALFAAGPAKYPTFGLAAQLAPLDLAEVRAYAERAFRAPNAVLIVTGAIDETVLGAALPGREGAAPGPEIARRQTVAPRQLPLVRSAGEAGFGLAWAGPAIADEREATAMDFLADYLFKPGTGLIQRSAERSGATLAGTFVTFHAPGVFLITATGGDLAAARAAVDAGLAAARRPIARADFEAARRAFVFHILADQETPAGLADSYGWYAVEGNHRYAPGEGGERGEYFAALAALTPEFVAATAAKYLGRGPAVVTLSPPKAPA